jgi:hypothetical protein
MHNNIKEQATKKSLEKKINFNVIPIKRPIIYYGEEGVAFFQFQVM